MHQGRTIIISHHAPQLFLFPPSTNFFPVRNDVGDTHTFDAGDALVIYYSNLYVARQVENDRVGNVSERPKAENNCNPVSPAHPSVIC